jgi:hypothetical protein
MKVLQRSLKNEPDNVGEAPPVLNLSLEMRSAVGGQFVELGCAMA